MNYAEIRKLYQMEKDVAVTIKMNINEGANPQNNHDRIVIKNMLAAAEERLLEKYKRREISALLKNLSSIDEKIIYNRNHKGLVLFVANDMADYTPLYFPVGNKVKIGRHFATRTLIRAFNQTEHYYILSVSQQEVRLIECFNNNFVMEHENRFPVINEEHYLTDRLEKSFASAQDKIIQQFFRKAEGKFQKVYKKMSLPVVLAGTEEAISNYEQVVGNNVLVIGKVLGNFDTHDGGQLNGLITQAYQVVSRYKNAKTEQVHDDLSTAMGKGRVEFNLNMINEQAERGQIAELVVDEDYYEKAVVDKHGVLFLGHKKDGQPLDDAVNYIIHKVKATGGDVVFVPPYSIDSHHRMAAILRWK